ncbi:MAG: hypothetical protein ACOC92_02290 [bacterium]
MAGIDRSAHDASRELGGGYRAEAQEPFLDPAPEAAPYGEASY